MASHWSSQNVVAEHKDVPATAMAVDYTGSYAVLAGRRLLALVNLDDPVEVQRRSTRGGHTNSSSKFDVKVLEWSPTKELQNYIALAAGNDCEVHTLDEGGRLVHKDLLHAHTRAISDLNWHSSEAHLLATASVESCLYLWDVREPRRPMSMLPATSGATQVKWNKKNSHLLASGHDRDLRIWDSRKPDQPMQYLAGHMAKVNSIDWSSHHEAQIVSASLDCCLRFFDITCPRRPHTVITTKHPVWRAKYTPFGRGVVSNLVPQLVRGNNSLLLWAQDQPHSPMHSFVGHTDAVINFDWRTNILQNGGNECQLVSWGRDRSLRIWKLDPHMQSLCGESFDEPCDLALGGQEGGPVQLLPSRDGSRDPSPGLLPVTSIKQEVPDDLEGSECGSNSTTTALGDGSAGTEGILLTAIKTEPLIDQFLEPRMDTKASDMVGITRGAFGSTSALVTAAGSAGGEGAPLTLLNATKSPTLSSSVPHESSFGMPSSTEDTAPRRMLLKDELSALQSEPWCASSSLNVDVACDANQRQVRVVVCAAAHTVGLSISIHRGYPNAKRLQFSLLPFTTLDAFDKMQIISSLNSVAQESARKEHNCLIALVSTLIIRFSALHKLSSGGIVSSTGALPALQDLGSPDAGVPPQNRNTYGSDRDHSVPFPRTSGARFCGNGILVCFTRPTFMSQKAKNKTAVHQTPRSLSALGAYIGNFKPDLSPVPKPYDSMRGILKPYNMIPKAPKNVRQYANSPAASSSKKVTTMTSQKLRQGASSGAGSSPSVADSRQRKRSLQNFHNRNSLSGNMEPSERGFSSAHHSRTAPVYGNGTLPSFDGGERDTDYNLADVSISKYYYQQRSCRKWRLMRSVKVGVVLVYRADALLPVSRTLAASYRLDSGNVAGSCTHNRLVTQRCGRRDLVQVWSLASRIVALPPTKEWSSSSLCKGLDPPWSLHPFASGLASKLLQHYASKGDVQTSSMLSCVFDTQQQQDTEKQQQQPSQQQQLQLQHSSRRQHPQPSPQAGGSPYNTIHGLKAEPPPEPCTLLVRHNRSSSEGSIAEAARPDHPTSALHYDPPSVRPISSLLTTEMKGQCDEFKRTYSDVLYNWNLLECRTEMQQYCGGTDPTAAEPEVVCDCEVSGGALRPHCNACKRPSILCTVCQLPVRGQSLLCNWCGHGGHTTHLLEWFSSSCVCASGCGCKCASYFSQ